MALKPIRVIQIGFGSLGIEIFKILRKNKKFKIIGVVDSDKTKIGKDCGILTKKTKSGHRIVRKINEIKSKPDIVIHATTSKIEQAYSQISEIAKKRVSVISTCEELVYPYRKHRKFAEKFDRLAKKYHIVILGVGINPGFLMDSMVLMLSGLCNQIDKISVSRIVNLGKRRRALQNKMCVGKTNSEFKKIRNKVGHVGLEESARMIADSLNLKLNFSSTIKPFIAKNTIHSNGIVVKRGRVSGIRQTLVGKTKNLEFLKMKLFMYVGAKEYDLIDIKGIPPIYLKTKGVNGDQSTIGLLTNYIPIVLQSKPGLQTVNKLTIPKFFN